MSFLFSLPKWVSTDTPTDLIDLYMHDALVHSLCNATLDQILNKARVLVGTVELLKHNETHGDVLYELVKHHDVDTTLVDSSNQELGLQIIMIRFLFANWVNYEFLA